MPNTTSAIMVTIVTTGRRIAKSEMIMGQTVGKISAGGAPVSSLMRPVCHG
jgi:hypothetical protein